MPKPKTPMVGCDTFTLNGNKELLLVKRKDSGLWALPGGFIDLGETPAECAQRECLEETGYKIEIKRLLGVFSSEKYEYVHYPWKDNKIIHLLFLAELKGGVSRVSDETIEVFWFKKENLPNLFDGHAVRIEMGFKYFEDKSIPAYFE